MINIFGDNRLTGLRGPKGKDGFNLMRWAPIGIKRLFRESEQVNIYFNTATDGIIYSPEHKPIGLKNHGLASNAKFLGKKFPEIYTIKYDRYMIKLKDSIFEIPHVQLGTAKSSTAIFLFTFKALEQELDKPRFLFSNKIGTRALSVEQRKIKECAVSVMKIYSSGSEKEIFFDEDGDWTGILIQYTCKNNVVYCEYNIGTTKEKGCLEPGRLDKNEDHVLYIGGHPDKSSAHHAMGSFELYHTIDIEGDDFALPETLQNSLLQDILDRVDE